MFSITRVDLSNFKSYAGEHSFLFPTDSGLYNLTGRNEVNPRLGRNATGKSTLLDAITWCLYGRTGRGLRADAIKARAARGVAGVALWLTVGPLNVIVNRTQSPNSLTLAVDGSEPKPVDQAALEKVIRLRFDEFIHSVLHPQGVPAFLDLSPTDKLSLFSTIMRLDYWLERSEDAKLVSADIQATVNRTEAKIASLTNLTNATKLDLTGLLEKQKTAVDEAASEANELDRQINEHERLIAQYEEALLSLNAKAQRAEKLIKDALNDCDKAREEIGRLATEAAIVDNNRSVAREKLSQLSTLGDLCPTCAQPINHAVLELELTKQQKFIKSLDAALSVVAETKSFASSALTKAKLDLHQAEKDKDAVTKNINDFSKLLSMEKQKSEYASYRRGQLTKQGDPYSPLIYEKRVALTEATKKLTRATRKRDIDSEMLIATKFWVDGFKRVKLFIVDRALRQFELEVNNNLAALGLVDWRVEFDVERENKSGGVTKGFTVLVFAPECHESIRYEAYSGGEAQRLRLAGDMGLSNLIMERAGLINTIEFWDEASAGLSEEGQLDLAEALVDRATNASMRIFMVDHNNLDFGGFAGTVTAVMTDEGSMLKTK